MKDVNAMTNKCKLCGEPMPEGEEMFEYHGYSGNCPKPPMTTPKTKQMEERLNEYWNEHDGTHFYKDELKDFITFEINLSLSSQRERIVTTVT